MFIAADIGLIAIAVSGPNPKKFEDDAEKAKQRFYSEVDPSKILEARQQYENATDKYNNHRKIYIAKKSAGIPLAIAAIYGSIRYWRKIKQDKPVAPVFNAPSNPYSFQLEFDPVQQCSGIRMSYTF